MKELKIDLLQPAIDHYNQKADELLLKLEPFKPAPPRDNTSSSNSHLYTHTFETKDTLSISISTVDGFGTMHSNYFETSDGQMGLSGDSYAECKKIVEDLSKRKELNNIVSYEFIHDSLFDWFRDKYKGQIDQDISFLTNLFNELNKIIQEYKIAIPISSLSIEKPFKIGNIEFDFLREDIFDEYEERALESVKDKKDVNKIKQGIINIRRNYQGKVCAYSTLTAEKNKAIEIAKVATENSLTILNFFSPPAFIPEFSNYIGRMGQIMIPESHIFIFEGVLPEIRTSFDEQKSQNWHITEQYLARLHEQNFDDFINMISNDNKTELEILCFRSIKYFTKAISSTDYHDRLVQLITSIELLLLKDGNEAIGDNVGRRLAFLNETSVESKLSTIKILKTAYKLRGTYLHHGKKTSVLDTLRELQLIIWSAIHNTVMSTSKFKTKSEFIRYLEHRILSG